MKTLIGDKNIAELVLEDLHCEQMKFEIINKLDIDFKMYGNNFTLDALISKSKLGDNIFDVLVVDNNFRKYKIGEIKIEDKLRSFINMYCQIVKYLTGVIIWKENKFVLNVPYFLWDKHLPIVTKVVGVNYEGRQEYLKSVNKYDLLLLKQEAMSMHENSIKVVHVKTDNVIGFIKREVADSLVNVYGKSVILLGVVTDVTGGVNNLSIGCNIQIVRVLV